MVSGLVVELKRRSGGDGANLSRSFEPEAALSFLPLNACFWFALARAGSELANEQTGGFTTVGKRTLQRQRQSYCARN